MSRTYLAPGSLRFLGMADDYVRFVMDKQLTDKNMWDHFVQVFTCDSDDHNLGWRCEFFGKMMRGAVLTYRYNQDENLYTVLEDAVQKMLFAQREDGRFSTYSKEGQLRGWDVWGRKYVLTGMLHFMRICRDESLKKRILAALQKHADALIKDVGPNENQTPITHTSHWWGGVNSCSVLEPILDLYTVTGEEKYLKFGEYIVSTGGCRDGNLIDLALENKVMPYQYPTVKAYETMSFFEGVMLYGQLTGQEKYLQAVKHFVDSVHKTDITVIGCAGCTHELFDHSYEKQTQPAQGIMQETCVTVTWMRLLAKMHLLTGDKKYMDWFEVSALNALYGAVNTKQLDQYSFPLDAWRPALPFDSYSPLYVNARGKGIGGYMAFEDGYFYGCCAAIAAAGIALVPLTAVLSGEQEVFVNAFLSGVAQTPCAKLTMQTTYPAQFDMHLTVHAPMKAPFALSLRVPDFVKNACAKVNGQPAGNIEEGCLRIRRTWQDGDEVVITGDMALRRETLNGKTALLHGPITLCRDEEKEKGADIASPIQLMQGEKGYAYRLLAPKQGEMLRMEVDQTNGAPLLLTDYASCGKNWLGEYKNITVWMNEE